LSLSHQVEQVPIVQYGTKIATIQTNIYSTIYVSNYKIYETIVRRYITKIVSRYMTPDGMEFSRVEVPTSYLETEYVSGRTTQYIGVKPVLVSTSSQITSSSLGVVA
jgi:hypothetical protein